MAASRERRASTAIRDGTYSPEQRAPVPEWQTPGDPRAAIRPMDLLRMSSGLRFIATQDPDYTPDKGYPDHFYIYTGAVNAYDYSIHQPLQFAPNTHGRYRNSDPLTLMYLAKLAVVKRGEEFLTWPQRALFDRIGIRRQVLETDPHANFLITGYDYGTARNWARLGLLYLQDGVWQGTRLLPATAHGTCRAARTSRPAPAVRTPHRLFPPPRGGAHGTSARRARGAARDQRGALLDHRCCRDGSQMNNGRGACTS